MSDLATFQARLGYRFRDEKLLRLAFTHPSVTHGTNRHDADNQRLEFLGDAVLSLVLSRELFWKLPEADEGSLTKARARLVNSSALAEHGRALGLGEHLVLSRGEENTGGRARASSLTDAFEALLGAIFLDGGFEAARDFLLREFTSDLATLAEFSVIANPKGELQELLQARSAHAPQYQIVAASGPDHDPHFDCVVSHEGVELARGRGKSKKAAESDAATEALKKLLAASGPSKTVETSPVSGV